MKKIHFLALSAVISFASIDAAAQVKVGSNPTTISANTNLDVEANNGTRVVVSKDNGNLGIGTVTPTSPLHVQNNSPLGFAIGDVQNLMRIQSNLGNLGFMDLTNRRHSGNGDWSGSNTRLQRTIGNIPMGFVDFGVDGKATNFGIGFGSGIATHMVVEADGNVGIGTVNPTAKLDVVGQIKISGGTPGAGKVLTSDADGLATWQAAAAGGSDGDAWGVTGENTNGSIYRSGSVSIGTSVEDINSKFIVLDTSNVADKATLRGASYSSPDNTNYNSRVGADLSAHHLGSGVGQEVRGVNTGVVTAGTGSIVNASSVYAQILNTGAGLISNAHGLLVGYMNAGPGTINNAYGVKISSLSGQNQWSVYADDADAPSYFAAKVGIGTTTPNSPLHVQNNSPLGFAIGDVQNLMRIQSNLGNSGFMDLTNRRHSGNGDWSGSNTRLQRTIDNVPMGFIDFSIDGKATNFGIGFGSGNATHMVVEADGNVGIGTVNPTAKLVVSGYVKVGSSDGTADVAPQAGLIRYNSATDKFQGFVGGTTNNWVDLH